MPVVHKADQRPEGGIPPCPQLNLVEDSGAGRGGRAGRCLTRGGGGLGHGTAFHLVGHGEFPGMSAPVRAGVPVPVTNHFASTKSLVRTSEPGGQVLTFATDMCAAELVSGTTVTSRRGCGREGAGDEPAQFHPATHPVRAGGPLRAAGG